MSDVLQTLLALPTPAAQRSWLRRHQPAKTAALVQALWAEADQRERSHPQSVAAVVQVAEIMANLWADQELQAVAWRLQASMQRVLGEHEVALTLYQKAIALYRTLGLEREAAQASVGPVDVLRQLGRYGEALDLAAWAIDQMRTYADPLPLGKLLVNQGNLFAQLADYPHAQASYAEAGALFAALGLDRPLAMIQVNEANVLTNLHDFRQAESLLHQARSHFAGADLVNAVARIDHNLACLRFAQADYQQALTLFGRAREIFVIQESPTDVALADLYCSEIYLALNLWQEALALAQSARPAFEHAQMPWECGRLWLNEAVALGHTAALPAARAALTQARDCFVQTGNGIWTAITDLYQATFAWRHDDLAAAESYVTQAQSIFQTAGLTDRLAQCAILLGQIALRANQLSQAAEHFTQALTWLQGAMLPAIGVGCHHGLGRVHQMLGKNAIAVNHYRQAIALIEQMQLTIGAEDYKMAFRRDKLQIYTEFIQLCLRLGTPAAIQEAFTTLQQAKARALLDGLTEETLVPTSQETLPFATELATLKQELNWYYNHLHLPPAVHEEEKQRLEAPQLTAAIHQREQALAALLQRWRAAEQRPAPRLPTGNALLTAIQSALPAGVLLLEWFTTERQTYVFGVTQQDLWLQRLPLRSSDATALIRQMQFYLNKFNYTPEYRRRHATLLQQGFDASLQELYQRLIQPLNKRLTTTHLLMAPHGPLHAIPFHALFDGTHYLLETKTITYTPSATVLQRLRTRPTPSPSAPPLILGSADPTIPYTQVEVAAVADLFPQAARYAGKTATTKRLRQHTEQPAFLHIATHAAFRTDNPLFSALQLADGWLTVNELCELPLVAPLITLSACETGRSHVTTGDELIGFYRSFLRAGARTVVGSLWPVEDRAAAAGMTYFYQGLQAGETVAQALRAAQLRVLQEQSHPYYWAPFVCIGDPWFQLTQTP